MAQRGVSQSMARNIVRSGHAIAQSGGKTLFFTQAGVVVLNKAGEVVTAYSSKFFDAAILMMNLDELRRSYTSKELFDYIDKNADNLPLGDQDVINALYCTKTRYVSPEIYNLDEKTALHSLKTHEWIEKNCSIVHYNGKYKPWKEGYIGTLAYLWHREEKSLLADAQREL